MERFVHRKDFLRQARVNTDVSFVACLDVDTLVSAKQ